MVSPLLSRWLALHKVSKEIDPKCYIHAIPGLILGVQKSLKYVATTTTVIAINQKS